MGFGVAVSSGGKGGITITTDMYPISYESFYVDKTKISAGGVPITHYIPFALNQEHWKLKGFEVAKESISLIVTGVKDRFKPYMVIDTIGELWKTKAVEMMKGEEHASEKILIGFCAFHHLLLAFALEIPEIRDIATKKVKEFISSPNARNKNACPDFGKFLPLFLISDIPWENDQHAGRFCVSELFTRNAMWILKQHQGLENPKIDDNRVKKSWAPSEVGLKLTCFQIRYLLEVGRPLPGGSESLEDGWKRLNSLLGRPNAKMTSDFQATVKRVQAIPDYVTWFEAMGLGKPPESVICEMLQDAMQNSSDQGYHGGRGGGRGGRGRGGR